MNRATIVKALLPILLSGFVLPSFSATKKKITDPAVALRQGREAFYNYDFEEAADLYDQYQALKKKTKKPLDEEFEIWTTQLEIAAGAFDRVQKIEIVDSINIPLDSLLYVYNLAPSAGKFQKLKDKGNLSLGDEEVLAYLNEDADFIFWPMLNEEGETRIMQARGLLDGDWVVEESLQGDFEKTGDYSYPFLSQDGQTLYFASDGEGSMGGLDIFVSQRDPFSNEYRQPLNIGMPFNSPYNDFMMAIDEENGIGWWATDRNAEEGFATVYIYLIDEIRKNYPAETEDLDKLAKITDFKSTQDPEKEEVYKRVRRIIRK